MALVLSPLLPYYIVFFPRDCIVALRHSRKRTNIYTARDRWKTIFLSTVFPIFFALSHPPFLSQSDLHTNIKGEVSGREQFGMLTRTGITSITHAWAVRKDLSKQLEGALHPGKIFFFFFVFGVRCLCPKIRMRCKDMLVQLYIPPLLPVRDEQFLFKTVYDRWLSLL